MVKKNKQAETDGRTSGSVFGEQTRNLAASFAKSSQDFFERLQSLRRELGEQFEFDEETSCGFWNPPADFNLSVFVISARQTYEAWMAAKHSNKEIEGFDGRTLATLAWLFDQMERTNAVPSELADACREFEQRYNRFELVLTLKTTAVKNSRITGARRHEARDAIWYDWRHIDKLTDGQIRDRWDRENPGNHVSRNNIENGLGIVASAIQREKTRRLQGTS